MQTLSDYIIELNINEHIVDYMPQMIFIMGLPAAGKSTFINLDLKNYFASIQQNRTLDVDIQLLKRQKDAAESFASKIYIVKNKKDFDKLVKDEENKVNSSDAMYGRNKFSLSVSYDWVEKNFSLRYKKFIYNYIKEFYKKDWASNFEVRPESKKDFNDIIKKKLVSLIDLKDDEIQNFNDNDLIIPITGDKISKILDFIEQSKNKYITSIVYLDMPEDVAIEKDAERKQKEGRGVGSKLIKEKTPLIEQSWNILKSSFKRYGIYKLLHFVWLPIEGKWGEYRLQKEYINIKIIKDNIGGNSNL